MRRKPGRRRPGRLALIGRRTGHVPELNGTSVTRILVDGPHAVVLGEIAQTVRDGGTAYTSPFALYLTVEDGLVTRYHIYEDSLTVARALSARP
jgi:ketosteroid isomerase-like protein